MKPALLLLSLLGLSLLCFSQPAPDTLWTHEYPDMERARATGVVPSFDGGLVVVGWQEFAPADTFAMTPVDMIVVKTDATGNPQWEYRIASAGDTTYQGVAICRSADSAYVVLSQRYYRTPTGMADFLLVKLDRSGALVWRRDYHYQDQAFARTLALMNDGTYLVGANEQIIVDNDHLCTNNLFVADVNASGDTVWTRIWRGDQCERLVHYTIATRDGGCLILGADCPPGPYWCHQLVLKLDSQGNTQWERMDPTSMDYFRVCAVEVSDGYAIGTNYYSITQLEKLDLSGQTLWLQPYEVETQRIEQPQDVAEAPDGGFFIASQAQLEASQRTAPVIIKTDAQGNLQWRIIADLTTGNNVGAFCQTPEGDLVFAGNSFVPRTYDWGHLWMEKYGWPNAAATEDAAMLETIALYPSYPNPFNPITEIAYDLPRTTRVSITVYDVLGQQIATLADGIISAGHHMVQFDGSSMPSGMYFCRLQTEEVTQSRKMMLLK
jgi:hypothetical protein